MHTEDEEQDLFLESYHFLVPDFDVSLQVLIVEFHQWPLVLRRSQLTEEERMQNIAFKQNSP